MRRKLRLCRALLKGGLGGKIGARAQRCRRPAKGVTDANTWSIWRGFLRRRYLQRALLPSDGAGRGRDYATQEHSPGLGCGIAEFRTMAT